MHINDQHLQTTALQLATRNGKKGMVELLLRRDADKNIKGGIPSSRLLRGRRLGRSNFVVSHYYMP
jgi:hypothetical protein